MAAPGITVVKSFIYRGSREEWSNQYHFVGSAPSDDAGWEALNTALINLEKLALNDTVRYERVYCYEDTSHDSVFTDPYITRVGTVTGSLSPGGGASIAPGDSAAWVRWKTARLNTHGKPIYLRKYFHGIELAIAGDSGADAVYSVQKTALEDFGTGVNAAVGSWPGIAGPDGVAPGASAASTFVTTRTLRRRGRRPS